MRLTERSMRRTIVSAVNTRPVPWQVGHASVMLCRWLCRTRWRVISIRPSSLTGERLRARAVAAEVRAQLLKHLVAVRLRLHVDEVADDDAADVAQAELPRDLARRLDVRLEDRLLRILLARVAARVHVDRDERLGRLDDQVAA